MFLIILTPSHLMSELRKLSRSRIYVGDYWVNHPAYMQDMIRYSFKEYLLLRSPLRYANYDMAKTFYKMNSYTLSEAVGKDLSVNKLRDHTNHPDLHSPDMDIKVIDGTVIIRRDT